MSNAQTHTDLESFLTTCRAQAIRGVVLRHVGEWRAMPLEKGVEVAIKRWVELAAYQGGKLHTLKLDGATAAEVKPQLDALGLTVRVVNGNGG